jgi:hypothetical protein
LNNLIEQDHRFIKRLVKPGMGFFSFETAWRTLQGYEVMNMIRKGQVQGVKKGDSAGQATFIAERFGMVISAQQDDGAFLSLVFLSAFLQQNQIHWPVGSFLTIRYSRLFSHGLWSGMRTNSMEKERPFCSRVSRALPGRRADRYCQRNFFR